MLRNWPSGGHYLRMQTAIVEIMLQGDMLNTVTKRVSAAEVPVIRSIHGADSVVKFSEYEVSDANNAEEIERLERVYGPAVRLVYTGHSPRLITSFAECGVEAPAPVVEKKSKLLKDN